MEFLNIAAYKFVAIADPSAWRGRIRDRCQELELKGTVLLAPEGINLFLAGRPASIEAFLGFLADDEQFDGRFARLEVKRSLSREQPFRRMLVRIKKEIITMRHPTIQPADARAPAVTAQTLKKWLDQGVDDQGRAVVMLDTRNAFEIELGTFENAVNLDIKHFGEFPAAIVSAKEDPRIGLNEKTIVTFCTGGIRCEKAAIYMAELDMPNVVQLDGGILKYFEEVGSAHWQGECFVFDDRVALDPQLQETATVQCYACRSVVLPMEQRDRRYIKGVSCRACAAPAAV